MSLERVPHYTIPNEERTVTPSEFRRLSKAKQIDTMRHWFFQQYADPNILPYDSGEGGYQWIWGGPYGTHDILEGEFRGIAKKDALAELESELNDQNIEWSRNPDIFPPDDDDALFFGKLSSDPYQVLLISLAQIQDATSFSADRIDVAFLHRLLFANILTALETYLADTFVMALQEGEERVERFLKTAPGLKDQKVAIGDVLGLAKNIWKPVRDRLNATLWHNFRDVAPMFQQTLKVEFPTDLHIIVSAISQRHDIVHRNGKSVDGVMGSWDATNIAELIDAVREFAKHIELQLEEQRQGNAEKEFSEPSNLRE